MKQEKRYKVAWISYEFLEDLFTEGNKIIGKVLNGIPKTATVRQIFYEPARACFGVVLHDKSFRHVKEGELLPQLNIKFKIKKQR